ncbi:hypothetical protein AAE478_008003 [Parahypoxylon ruwenzoriense]
MAAHGEASESHEAASRRPLQSRRQNLLSQLASIITTSRSLRGTTVQIFVISVGGVTKGGWPFLRVLFWPMHTVYPIYKIDMSSRRSSAKDKNFEQYLIDCNIYREGHESNDRPSPEPSDIDEIKEKMAIPRA